MGRSRKQHKRGKHKCPSTVKCPWCGSHVAYIKDRLGPHLGPGQVRCVGGGQSRVSVEFLYEMHARNRAVKAGVATSRYRAGSIPVFPWSGRVQLPDGPLQHLEETMINLPLTTILALWDEFHECMEGRHGFGGNTCEIYAYTLTGCHQPRACRDDEPGFDEELEFQLAGSLTEVLQHFCSTHNCTAIVAVSGSSVGGGTVHISPKPGRSGSVPPFSHRAHITIERCES